MHEQITNLGWAWHGHTCKCEGNGKLYIKGIYKLKHYDKGHFKLMIRNNVIAADTDTHLLEAIKDK